VLLAEAKMSHLPYQKFAGISMILDAYTKKVTRSHCEHLGMVPAWLQPLGIIDKPVPIPHHSRFFYLDRETNIHLSGSPDEMFLMKDTTFSIIDYKTAKFSANQNSLHPMYQAQLNGYALIAEENGYNPVSQIDLVYLEPQSEVGDNLKSVLNNEGFCLPFKSRIVPVELNSQETIKPLLKQARNLFDMQSLPEPRQGCKDCQMINDLVNLFMME
jgi:hypothetical protein